MGETFFDNHKASLGRGKKQCMGCMEFYDSDFDVCPHCGCEETASNRNLLHMAPGSLLAGRYVIGHALGSGSFGITYIGWDTKLKRKVAVKEYFPCEFATRLIHHQELMMSGGEKDREQFQKGKERFLSEGKKLAKAGKIDGVVYMYECFEENNTAYIVMEYLEGETLESFLEHEGILSEQKALELAIPILQALEAVHEMGIIHRDISPDNIFLSLEDNGKLKVKLIDFGAARFATTSHSKSLTVLVKQGYSPEEQYATDGIQGPYTDVYAMAGVIYRMVTGKRPPDATDRRNAVSTDKRDPLEEPGNYNKELSANFEIALLNALNISSNDRTETAELFLEELVSYEPVKRRGDTIRRIDFFRWPLWAKIGVPMASVAAMALLIFAVLKVIDPVSVYQLPDGMVRVPDLVAADFSYAQKMAEEKNLIIASSGSQYSPNAASDIILEQDVASGTVTYENTEIKVVISTGQETYILPDVTGLSVSDAQKVLGCMGLKVLTTEGEKAGAAGGCVITQSIEPYGKVNYGDTITLTVTGNKAGEAEKTAPSLMGLTYEEALKTAADAGVLLVIKEKSFSKEVSETKVISQSINAGETVPQGMSIEIAAAIKWQEFPMPNLMYKEAETAKQILKNMGIKAEISEESSEAVTSGLVFKQNVEKETIVSPGQTIALSVSKGSKPFAMPKVEGMTEEEARQILSDKKLSVSVEYAYDENVPEGKVISQNHAAGSDITRGTAVTIIVCSTEGLITVKDISGRTQEEAISILKEQGLKTKVEESYSQSVKAGIVMDQLPKAGSIQKKDTVIVLTVSKGKKPDPSNETTKAPTKETTKAPTKETTKAPTTESPKNWKWSDWSTTVPSGKEYEKKTQYSSRTLETTTSDSSSLPGWTLDHTTNSWGEYGSWSDWSTTVVSASESTKVETKKQYRYQNKETTTSTSSSLSGWTQTGSSVSYGSWGSWSTWRPGSDTSTDTKEVQNSTVYGYYYFKCPKCGAHMHVYTACYTWAGGCGNSTPFESGWTQMWSNVSWDNAGFYEFHGTGRYATDSMGGGRWFKWTDNGSPRAGNRYRERSKTTTYTYERWGSWSSWSDTAYASSSTRNVQTRTVYRYCTRSKKTTYYYTRWSDWSAYTDTKITEDDNTEVRTRTMYRYKIYY